MNLMDKKPFDIIMYTNAAGLGVDCIDHAHRLPFIKGIAKAMEGVGNILVVLRYSPIPQCWLDKNKKFAQTSSATSGLIQLGENLWTIRPTVVGNLVLACYLTPIKWQLRRQIRNQINHAMISLNMNYKRVAWMTHPYHYLYRGCAGESALVYECYDEYVFDSSGKENKRTELLEIELARNADLNITTAKPLFDKLFAVDKKTKQISNGVMYDLFSQCQSAKVFMTPELVKLKPPIIGMIGVLARGYDFNLIDDIIAKKNEWSFAFVGKIAGNARQEVERLSRYQNFHVFGWRPYQEILPFLKGFDVAIIPYLVNDWTNTINPNKVYDYFAAGVPVVATPIVELCNHRESLTLCQNSDEFIKAIEKAIKGELEDKVQRGIHKAKALSWDSITIEIVGELESLMA